MKKIILLLLFVLFFNLVSASDVGLIENSTWQENLTGVRFSTTIFGDVDKDNDQDLIITGCLTDGANDCENGAIAKIYINNGTTLTENQTWQQNLTGVGWGSNALGDVDNDGDLDLIFFGCTESNSFGVNCNGDLLGNVYLNNGTSFVESSQWQQNLVKIHDSSTNLGDIDNDGDLDLVVNGRKPLQPNYVSKIYINNGTSFVESSQWQQNLIGAYEGQAIFGDIDEDNYLDIILTGDADFSDLTTKIYLNNRTSFVESSQWQQSTTSVDKSSLVIGNFDSIGGLDFLLTGKTSSDLIFAYINNLTTFVENQNRDAGDLIGIYRASLSLGDYDNDGDLDLIGFGHEHGRARVYENNDSNFIQDKIAHAGISDEILEGASAWADLDNDGDLDLSIAALDFATTLISKIYINNNTVANTLPNASTSGFSSSYSNGILNLSWGNGTDSETPIQGLYYNLMIGNSTTNHTVVSGIYGGSSGGGGGSGGGANGYFGNMMQRKSIVLNKNLSDGTYYWYVQTIDTGLAKSSWSAVQSFVVSDTTSPTITLNSPEDYFNSSSEVMTFNVTVFDDLNLTNVSLWGSWEGRWHLNETNSSGLNNTEYIFIKDLTNDGDGNYTWMIRAEDNETNTINSSIRTFTIDTSYPIVDLISPANASTWTSSSTVTFSYNVTDIAIANCSLIIDNSVDQTDSSITENTTQTFTKTIANGAYYWNINCTDYVGYTNASETRNLSVSYTAPVVEDTGGGGGGGGGGSTTIVNETATQEELFDVDFSSVTQETLKVREGDIKTFSFQGEIKHSITVITLGDESLTLLITSDPITIQIDLWETKQIDINQDGIDDLEIKFNSVVNGVADLFIKKLEGATIVAQEELDEAIRKEALFDVKVSIVNLFEVVKPGREVIAEVEALNVNNIGQVDVVVNYYITSKEDNQTKLVEGSDTLAVEAVASIVRNLRVPYDAKAGKYLFNVDISYQDKLMASGSSEFRVIKGYTLIIIVGIIVLIVAGIFFYLWKIKKKEEKDIGQLKSKEMKDIGILKKEIGKLKGKKSKLNKKKNDTQVN